MGYGSLGLPPWVTKLLAQPVLHLPLPCRKYCAGSAKRSQEDGEPGRYRLRISVMAVIRQIGQAAERPGAGCIEVDQVVDHGEGPGIAEEKCWLTIQNKYSIIAVLLLPTARFNEVSEPMLQEYIAIRGDAKTI